MLGSQSSIGSPTNLVCSADEAQTEHLHDLLDNVSAKRVRDPPIALTPAQDVLRQTEEDVKLQWTPTAHKNARGILCALRGHQWVLSF